MSQQLIPPPPLFRATLYVGKYSTSLYASPSLVHDGVTVVVSDSYIYFITSAKHLITET